MSENRFSADSLRSQTAAILQAWGMSRSHAITTAEAMVDTDLLGVDSHGVSMLPQYAVLRRNGRLRLDASPTVLRDGPATALIDAGAGLGHVASVQAMALAVDKARRIGIALVVFDQPDGGLTPLGGNADGGSHKGYGLSLLAQVLGGTLNGGAFAPLHNRSHGPGGPANVGHSFIAIDPAFFGEPSSFQHDLDGILDVLHATPPLDPRQPVLVPGDPEAAQHAERTRHGVPLPEALERQLREVAEDAGVPFTLQAIGRAKKEPHDHLA